MDGAGNNDKKVLRSRNGVKVTLDDSDGQETADRSRRRAARRSRCKDGPGAVEIVDSNGNSIKLETERHHDHRLGQGDDQRVSTWRSRPGMVTVNAGMSKFSGVVQADTRDQQQRRVSASYTPGAGNIW